MVVWGTDGEPAVLRNAPLLGDGTPMPTRYWLLSPSLRRAVDRIESAGGVRAAEAAVDRTALDEAHRRYAAERDAALPEGWDGPRPTGGVGGTRRGVKCLHAHLAWRLAGGDDPVGEWTDAALDRSGAAEVTIRSAVPGDVADILAIEVAAGDLFRRVGMDAVADDTPPSPVILADYQAAGRAWLAVRAGRPVGFILAEELDGNAHVEQVSVHPDAAGRRLGAALIDVVGRWAADQRLPAITLTTFDDVPWNRPYYERLGFSPVADDELGVAVRTLLDNERARFRPWTRVAMSRPQAPTTS